MTNKKIDILQIDARGRIVIPDDIRKKLNLLEESYLISIGKPDKKQVTLSSLSESKETATFLLKSESLPEAYESSISELSEKLWGLQTIMLTTDKSAKEKKRLIKSKVEHLKSVFPESYKINVINMKDNGRFVMPNSLRRILDLKDDSYLICITDLIKKEMDLYPFIGAGKIETLSRKTEDGVEWVIKPTIGKNSENSFYNNFDKIE